MNMEHWQRMQRENENLKKQLKAHQKERAEMEFLFRYHREMTAALDITREEQAADIEALRREIERLTAERDTARREVCNLLANQTDDRGPDEAYMICAVRGWDCFKEEAKP